MSSPSTEPSSHAHFTRNSVPRSLAGLTLPMLASIAANIGVSVIDIWFVSKLGTEPLAAISFTFPVLMLLVSVALGIGIGCSSVLARVIGKGDPDDARDLSGHGLLLVVVLLGVITLLSRWAIEPLFSILGAKDSLMPQIRSYMSILHLAIIPMALTMVATQMLRAAGNVRLPAKVIMISAGVHIILDPLLIFGLLGMPKLELAGAAWAMLVSRLLSSMILIGALHRHHDFTALKYGWGRVLDCWYRILHVGVPASLTHLIPPLSISIITRLVAEHGTEAVAGFGVATRIESLAVMPLFALSASIGPFIGQNMGAGLIDRMHQAIHISYQWVLIWGATIAVILALGAWPIAGLFDDNHNVQQVTVHYLWLIPWSYGAWGIMMVSSACFNSIGKPLPNTVMSVVRIGLLNIPLAVIASIWFGYQGIFSAFAVTNLVMAFVGYFWLKKRLLT